MLQLLKILIGTTIDEKLRMNLHPEIAESILKNMLEFLGPLALWAAVLLVPLMVVYLLLWFVFQIYPMLKEVWESYKDKQ